MISFRHHLLTIVAVFLALAVGIVLGGGPLSQVAGTTAAGPKAAAGESSSARTDYADGFATAVGPRLYADRLDQRRVVLVTLPGADDTVVSSLQEQVGEAGGTFTGHYALTEAMVDPEQKSLVDTLGSQLMTQGRADEIDEGATTYDRMGELLGDAVSVPETGGDTSVDNSHLGVVDGLVGAELMTTHNKLESRAPLVLVVLGDGAADGADTGADAILAGLLTGLSRSALGVVVAGTTADGGKGQLGRFREEPGADEVTTVDGVDTAAGRVATVMALGRSVETRGGSFGASGADGPVPLG